MFARWPELEGEVDEMLLKEADYLQTVSHEFRVRLKKMMEIREKVEQPPHPMKMLNPQHIYTYTSLREITHAILVPAIVSLLRN